MKKKLLIFNSGSGSGFQELVENARTGILDAEIVGLVTDNSSHFCVTRAHALEIPVFVMEDYTAKDYQIVVDLFKPDFIALSGWLKLVRGLDPRITFNIHPGPLPHFGGKGMYGMYVHEAVIQAFKEGRVENSAVTMHFVTEQYDKGPIFFSYPVFIRPDDTARSLGTQVNKIEHGWQSFVTNLVVTGQIYWDGKNPESLVKPAWLP